MRRFLASAFALAVSSAIAAPVLACEGFGGDQPVVIRRDDQALLAEAGRLDVMASASLTSAATADRDAGRLVASAQKLRVEARLDGQGGFDLIQAAVSLETKAAGLRARAGELRMRAGELKMRAGELRASVQRPKPPMMRSAGSPNGVQRAVVRL
jgi:hypothetical protein